MSIIASVSVVSAVVDLLQLVTIGFGEFQKVSVIIGKRIAEGRTEWTPEELMDLEASLEAARTEAVGKVAALPDA